MGNNNNYKNNPKNYQPQNVGNQITASILILSVILSFTLGIIGGYLIGEARTESRISNSAITITQPNNQGSSGSTDDEIQQSVDYSQYVINGKKGITVESFYSDAESKMYASALINTSMPTIKWTDSAGVQHSNADFGSEQYIIEIFSPTCGHCNASIPVVDKFRENNTDIPVVSLTTDTNGDISAFNAAGENAFVWKDIDAAGGTMMNYIPWIPTFLYVEDGVIQLVTYGGVNEGDIESYMEVAFDK